ncbi:hypothetical protein ASG87_00650 [Frateuria sp. Soil773]|uniref:virion core protein, T7 gp14 family n=1 Tax=Frateuria sp. Soil773 TaxID=1736407 RepID=UPI0006FC788C|nr:hypothetical protein [Frateuria sp. Soil773]KRE92461.1 hypothetical protein ASG87_00650 [Frateuria sp. Soil773]
MCEPTTIALATMAALSAATAIYASNEQKHATEDQLKLQQKQQDAAAQVQTNDRLKAAREARASARAAAAEVGLSGNSAQAILQDIQMQAGTDVSRIEKNRESGNIEATQQAKSRFAEINGNLAQGVAGAFSQGMSAYANRPPHSNGAQYDFVKDGVASDVEGYKRDLSRFTIRDERPSLPSLPRPERRQ